MEPIVLLLETSSPDRLLLFRSRRAGSTSATGPGRLLGCFCCCCQCLALAATGSSAIAWGGFDSGTLTAPKVCFECLLEQMGTL